MGVPGCSAAIRRFKVQRSPTTLPHPPSSAKWPRSAAAALGPWPRMIGGVDAIARGVERGGETGVAAAMLGEPVRDLDDRARRTFWQPTPREEALAIVGAKRRIRSPALPPPDLRSSPSRFAATPWNLARIRWRRQAGGRQGNSPRRIGCDRLGAESHGAVYLHHRRRGLLSWQGSRFSGFRRRFCRRAAIPSACASSIPISTSIRAR